MYFGFTDTIFLHSGHQHFLATHVAIFRVVRTRIQIQLKCVPIIPQFNNRIVFGYIQG